MNIISIKNILLPAGRGSVIVIAILLLSSASLRVMTSASSALAKGDQLPTATKQLQTEAQTPVIEEHENRKHEAEPPINRSDISELITALTEREAQVSKREKQIEIRMRALSVADGEIEKRIKALTDTESALRATLSLADEASEKDLLRLTAVYESMKPKDAAVLFEEMEPNFAAGFLGRMRPDVAAQVMAGLSPQVAYSISVILAGRNATVPKS